MKDFDHAPYHGYPKFWTIEELGKRVIKVFKEVSDDGLDGKVELERLRVMMESVTRVNLVAIDMAIRSVANVGKEGVVLSEETRNRLKDLERQP